MKNIDSTTGLFLLLLCLLCATGCNKTEQLPFASGKTKELRWTLSEDGTLTINGKGKMPDYIATDYNLPTPWEEYKNIIISVVINKGVTSIGDIAFASCTNLTSVIISNSVTSIGRGAFSQCSSLKLITIPTSVTSIGSSAFWNCSGLTSITIPTSVTSIGSSAFYNTPWYNSQPDGLMYIGDILYIYKGTMPANTTIVIQDGTTSIAENAFYNCSSLTSITIPNSVISIGSRVFFGCSSLTEVINESTIPQTIGSSEFYNVNLSACTLRVPAASVDAYCAAPMWENFGNIVAIQ